MTNPDGPSTTLPNPGRWAAEPDQDAHQAVGLALYQHGGSGPWLSLDRHKTKLAWSTDPVPAGIWAATLTHHGRCRFLGFDLDTKKQGVQMVEEDVDRLTRLLNAAGLGYFVCASGPTGGRHLYVPIAAPYIPARLMRSLAQRLRRAGIAPSLDCTPMLNEKKGALRLPGSDHPEGGFNRVICSIAHAMSVIQSPNDPALIERLVTLLSTPSERHSGGGPRQDLKLQLGPYVETATLDCSEELWRRAHVHIAWGRSFEQFAEHMEGLVGPRMQKRVSRGRKYLRNEWAHAVQSQRNRARARARSDDAVIAAWAAELLAPAPGINGYALRVAEAILRHVLRRHEDRAMFGMDVRSLGELAGCSRQAAAEALEELIDLGLIHKEMTAEFGLAARFRLTPTSTAPSRQIDLGASGGLLDPLLDPTLDMWDAEGLREEGRVTYRWALSHDAEVLTVADVQSAFDLQESAARRRLNSLAKAGLLHDLGRGRGWSVERPDPEAVAAKVGTAGKTEARRRTHLSERAEDALQRNIHRLQKNQYTIPGPHPPQDAAIASSPMKTGSSR